MAANDSQPQPGFLTQLMQKILGATGLAAAASQGGPGQAPATPPQNPWVKQSAAPAQAAPAGPANPAPVSDPQGDLSKIIQHQMEVMAQQKAAEQLKKQLTTPVPKSKRPPSSQVDTSAPIMQLFNNLVGKVAS